MKPLWLLCIVARASSHHHRASQHIALEAQIDKLVAQPTISDENNDKMSRSLRSLITRTFEEIDSTEFECHAEHEASRAHLLALKSDLAALRQDAARQRSFFLNARAQLFSAKERMPVLENRRHEVEQECSRAKQRSEAELDVLTHHVLMMEAVMRQVQCNKTVSFLQARVLRQVTRCNDGTVTLASPAGDVKVQTTHALVKDANYARPLKCVTSRLNCYKMYDLAHALAGEVADSKKDLESTTVKQSLECARELAANNAAMGDLTNTVFEAQTALARATSEMNVGEAEMGKKEQERRFEQKEFDASRKTCKEKLDMMRYTDLCVYRKLRKKLAESAGVPLPTDCEVGAWVVNGRCSQSCGGGTGTLSREIIISSQGLGAPCPTLHWERQCKMDPCPQECEVAEWTGWSTCSTDCGGGVQQRTRDLLVEARHGATACLTTQSQICNTSSCSRDCVLSHWSGWLPCSRACGGGTRARKRRVIFFVPAKGTMRVRKVARGDGKCPKATDPLRWQSETCNRQACAKFVKPVCAAPYDVVIVVDASLGVVPMHSTRSSAWRPT
eukprot:GEMP01029147.1.p1 GENE.GEMP01029147.1~~GEMP01029147.1.p1  ORF type:complete len:559 (+),score=151.89 GEMP01029147.1:37-1713(+)